MTDRFFLFLAGVGSLTVLCQYFVFVSIRKHIFGFQADINRASAYGFLVLAAAFNILSVKYGLDHNLLQNHEVSKRIINIVFFSQLGFVLVLSLFLVFQQLLSALVGLLQYMLRAAVPGTRSDNIILPGLDEKGCLQTHHAPGEISAPQILESQDPKQIEKSEITDLRPSECTEKEIAGSGYSRRGFLKAGTSFGLVAALGITGEGIAEGYGEPVVEKFEFLHEKLMGLNSPLRIIQVSDFHFGMFWSVKDLERLVRAVNRIDADAVLITGDIFHSPVTPVESAKPVLMKLAHRKLGTFAVMGNHDFYAGEKRSAQTIQESGITLLRNKWVTFGDGASAINLGGIDDPITNWLWGGEFPYFEEFSSAGEDLEGLKILMSHRPMILPLAARAGFDLVLSGHTHGGQVILPDGSGGRGVSLAGLVSPYTHGWYREGECRMYLNRGAGLTFVPWRINCPPEITVITMSPVQRAGS
jgi:uncharacterized protein